jgi:hypothetical protein
MDMVLGLIAGMLVMNSAPHLIKGITNTPWWTPFKRHEKSSAFANVLWGWVNLGIAYIAIWQYHGEHMTDKFILFFGLGLVVMSILHPILFQKGESHD